MPRKKKVENIDEIKIEEIDTSVVEDNVKPKKKKEEKHKTITVIKPRVNIRKTPSLLGEILGIVTEGEKFELLEDNKDGGFYCINYNGLKAYIMATLVK